MAPMRSCSSPARCTGRFSSLSSSPRERGRRHEGPKDPKGHLAEGAAIHPPLLALVGISILLAAVTVAASLYIPILTGGAVDLIVGPGNVEFAGIVKILVRIGVVIGLAALSQWVMSLINNRITYRVVRDIRNEAFRKIQILPLKYIDGHPAGEVVSRVIADVDQFADGLLMGFTQLFSGVITILGTLCFMLSVNVLITLVVVVITPVSLVWRPSSPSAPMICSGSSPRCGGSRPALWRKWWRAKRWCRPSAGNGTLWRSSTRSTSGCASAACGPFSSPPSPTLPPGLSTPWCTPAWALWAPCR